MDILDLKEFYHSPLGHWVCHVLRTKIKELWPNTKGETILGLGYCAPYLTCLRNDATRTISLAPASQGALRWPREEPCLTLLAEPHTFPFRDEQFNRVLVVHSLESCEQIHKFMREIWRVLTYQGKLLLIVPNRSSMWSHIERTPFGQGHPYTLKQILKLLRANFFMCTQKTGALYMPPTTSRLCLSSASTWETIGKRWCTSFSGVLMIEAVKQIYAGTPLESLKLSSKPILLPVSD